MLDKKEQNELLSRSIYTSDYYRQRWNELLQTYQEGCLTYDQWARQNYQLNCVKTFYNRALEREQQRKDLYEQNLRQRRAQCVFNQWKEAKEEGHSEQHRSHVHTAHSQRAIEVNSALSTSIPNNTTNRMSVSSLVENDFEELPLFRPVNSSKNTTVLSKTSYMLNEQRWSLEAMLKRVVGLAEPLPPPPKLPNRRYSSLTNVSNDSGFESGP